MVKTTITLDFEDFNIIIAHGIYTGLARVAQHIKACKAEPIPNLQVIELLEADEARLRCSLRRLEQALYDGGDHILGVDHKTMNEFTRES